MPTLHVIPQQQQQPPLTLLELYSQQYHHHQQQQPQQQSQEQQYHQKIDHEQQQQQQSLNNSSLSIIPNPCNNNNNNQEYYDNDGYDDDEYNDDNAMTMIDNDSMFNDLSNSMLGSGSSKWRSMRLKKHFTVQTSLLLKENEPAYVGAFAVSSELRTVKKSPLSFLPWMTQLFSRTEFMLVKSAILVFITGRSIQTQQQQQQQQYPVIVRSHNDDHDNTNHNNTSYNNNRLLDQMTRQERDNDSVINMMNRIPSSSSMITMR